MGLTPNLLRHAPNIARLGTARPWTSPLPAVTSTAQATLLTGLMPNKHGIVANGWYFRDTAEIRFWQQHNGLVQGQKFYEGFETAKMFWWFNQNSGVRYSCTPKPHYGSDGSKVFDVLDHTECNLTSRLGPFPFHSFWGPKAGLPSSQWIAESSAIVLREKQPEITLVYLPHLDYEYQRRTTHDPARVAEVDACAQTVIEAALEINAIPIVVSEYGLVPVSRSVPIQQHLRRLGRLSVRGGPFGEMLLPGESSAFAVCDHQVAHIYVSNRNDLPSVQREIESLDGVAAVVSPAELQLDHPRSGELIALAEPDAWFNYYYWLDDQSAPDFARTVDIHRKPGYDPCELFMTSMPKALFRLAQKKAGLRYRMDVIPLEPKLVGGSHGLSPQPEDGPLIIGPEPPDRMVDFFDYVRRLLRKNPPMSK